MKEKFEKNQNFFFLGVGLLYFSNYFCDHYMNLIQK